MYRGYTIEKEVVIMEKIYLITGATGFLGHMVTKQLAMQQKKVVGLRLPGDKAHLLPGWNMR